MARSVLRKLLLKAKVVSSSSYVSASNDHGALLDAIDENALQSGRFKRCYWNYC